MSETSPDDHDPRVGFFSRERREILEEAFPNLTCWTEDFLLDFLSENAQVFTHGRRIPSEDDTWSRTPPKSNDAWNTLLADALLDAVKRHHPDSLAELSAEWRDRGPDTSEVQALGLMLHNLASDLGIVGWAEKRTVDGALSESVRGSKGVTKLLLPAHSLCVNPLCEDRLLIYNASYDASAAATAIVRFNLYDAVAVRGHCGSCKSNYFADRIESLDPDDQEGDKIVSWIDQAKLLMISEKLWVDRPFASDLLAQVHHSRGSFSSLARVICERHPDFGGFDANAAQKCFLHESIRRVAAARGATFRIVKGASTEVIARAAYLQLGDEGRMPGTAAHRCAGCCKPAEAISRAQREQEDDHDAAPEASELDTGAEMTLNELGKAPALPSSTLNDEGEAVFRAAAVDVIVMGPRICGISGCHAALEKYPKGTFCRGHWDAGDFCQSRGCDEPCSSEHFCEEHEELEELYTAARKRRKTESEPGAMRRRSRAKPTDQQLANRRKDEATYKTPQFGAGRSYGFAAVSYTCGLIRRCGRLVDREEPSDVNDFLLGSFDEDEKPTFIFSDKACLLLKYLCDEYCQDQDGETLWSRQWKGTTRFVVDPFHLKAHPLEDVVCRRHARPEAFFGQDEQERPFNTSIAEQNNSHLSGYKHSADAMLPAVFDWFMFTDVFMMNAKRLAKRKRVE